MRPSRLRKDVLGLPKEKRLWSDEVLDTELDDIYKRLQREEDTEKHAAEVAEWRRDMPLLHDPKSEFNSNGMAEVFSHLVRSWCRIPRPSISDSASATTPHPIQEDFVQSVPRFTVPVGSEERQCPADILETTGATKGNSAEPF